MRHPYVMCGLVHCARNPQKVIKEKPIAVSRRKIRKKATVVSLNSVGSDEDIDVSETIRNL